MTNRLGIYTIVNSIAYNDTTLDAISELGECCSTTIVSVCSDFEKLDLVQAKFPDAIIVNTSRPRSASHVLLKDALSTLSAEKLAQFDQLVLTGSQVLGPFDGLQAFLDREDVRTASIFAAFAFRPQNEHRKEDHSKILEKLPEEVASSEFMVMNSDVLSIPALYEMLLADDDPSVDNHILTAFDLRIYDFCAEHDIKITLPVDYGRFETTTPVLFESDSVIEAGVPFLSTHLIHISYTVQDLNALNLRRTLETIRKISPDSYQKCWDYILATGKLRDVHAIADEVEIFDEIARNPDKNEWSFGPVAVFIHAFYAEMMEEFYALLERIDVPKKVFITTATTKNRQGIEVFLGNKGVDADEFEIRVVEQNRGRDMSSLFISFRDVIMSGDYDVCLRLHSKRTPQVMRQVGQSFKDHLFDNLVYTSGYVRNVLDFMEENPNVGLMMPPTIHVGFGTLGHSWFNNRKGVEEWAEAMELDVKLDDHTPLAPYGTMYWFRAEALRKMFEFEWRWDNYNEEPMHVDGGVAHLQERLIGYVAQDAGFRVMSIANRRDAARNYARLEYKLQMLAAEIPHANIYYQHRYMLGFGSRIKTATLGAMTKVYQHHVMTRPGVHRVVRPMARYVKQILG